MTNTEAYATYDAAFTAARDLLVRTLTSTPGLIREYTEHLAGTQGKFIRAAALLACAQAEDGSVPADAVQFAAAVELLHAATLVHDDIMDDADLRRGQSTLQKKFGKRTAVICGDYLLCMALRLAAGVEDKAAYLKFTLPDYVGRVCLGELNQHLSNYNFSLTVNRYLRIIGGKTAALFEGAYSAGALLCTPEEKTIRRYGRLGRYVGMIFQLTDDCIDFEADREAALKPVQSDFEQGVVTLPMICAFQQDESLRQRAEAGQLDTAGITEGVRRANGLGITRQYSKWYYSHARALLNTLDLPVEKQQRLSEILERAYRGLKK